MKEKDEASLEIKDLVTFLKQFTDEKLAELLLEEIFTNEDFDIISFGLFSRLIEESRQKNIASFLKDRIEKENLDSHPQIKKKIRDLFLASDSNIISQTYRNTLSFFIKDLQELEEEGFSFKREILTSNYRLTLLNLLCGEKNKEKIKFLLEKISKEKEEIIKDKDLNYLKNLFQIIEEIRLANPDLDEELSRVENEFLSFIEEGILKEEIKFEIGFFLRKINRPSFDFQFYMGKIFRKKEVNPFVLQLILKFFPRELDFFYMNLKKKKSDFGFLKKIIENLKTLNLPIVLEVLKFIFSFPNKLIKIEVLRAMQEIPFCDWNFLFFLLKKEGYFLKKEATAVLIKKGERKEVGRMLFSIFNPFGLRNRLLKENLRIAKELNLKESKEFLIDLKKKKFLGKIKKEIDDLLDEWDED